MWLSWHECPWLQGQLVGSPGWCLQARQARQLVIAAKVQEASRQPPHYLVQPLHSKKQHWFVFNSDRLFSEPSQLIAQPTMLVGVKTPVSTLGSVAMGWGLCPYKQPTLQ